MNHLHHSYDTYDLHCLYGMHGLFDACVCHDLNDSRWGVEADTIIIKNDVYRGSS